MLALGFGALGAGIGLLLNIPLALLLGPLILNMIVALMGVDMKVPDQVRTPITALMGAFMATQFSPEVIGYMVKWPISIAVIPIYIGISTVLVGWYLLRMTQMDRPSAIFSAVPGGLITMIAIGQQTGGNEQHIAMAHVLRIFIAVFLVVYGIWGFMGFERNQTAMLTEDLDADYLEVVKILILTAIGVVGAMTLKIPAPHFIGPMFVVAPFYLYGVLTTALPGPLLGLALWTLGSAIGSRFAGFKVRTLLSLAPHIFVSIMILLAISVLFATALSRTLNLPFLAVLLAFAPGGVAEMSLIALALNEDPAYVAVHHLIRIALCILAAPLFIKFATQTPETNDSI